MHPKISQKFRRNGLTLEEAKEKENFLEKFYDTDDCDNDKRKQAFNRLHPVESLKNQVNFNNIIEEVSENFFQ